VKKAGSFNSPWTSGNSIVFNAFTRSSVEGTTLSVSLLLIVVWWPQPETNKTAKQSNTKNIFFVSSPQVF